MHVLRVVPTRIPCTEEAVNLVAEAIAVEFGINVLVRNLDGYPFIAAVEAAPQKLFLCSILKYSTNRAQAKPSGPTTPPYSVSPCTKILFEADTVEREAGVGMDDIRYDDIGGCGKLLFRDCLTLFHLQVSGAALLRSCMRVRSVQAVDQCSVEQANRRLNRGRE